jgi:phosphatidylglycerophosphatase A
MPGTWGTLGAIPIYFLLFYGGWQVYLFGYLSIFLIGWFVSYRAERVYRKHDDSRIVIDEVSGYLTTMFLVPQPALLPFNFVFGFFLFRIFDILKPGPIGTIDKIQRPICVMLDDVLAGVFACATMWIIAALIHFFQTPILPEIFAR